MMKDRENLEAEISQKKPRRSRKGPTLVAAFVLIVVCFFSGFFGGAAAQWLDDALQVKQVSDGNNIVTKEERDITSVVKKVSPSVVSVLTSQTKRIPFERAQRYVGAGTGMIVSSDGYVLTNKHVVEGADEVQVVMSDGTTYDKVKVVGVDPLNDVAFLKIPNVSDLPKIELGDSKTIRIGQKVVAIGNALGQYQNTVTSGIISGTGRPVTARSGAGSVETLNDLIQTDAAINEGNSGGPLLNLQGQVIGINTAVAAEAQGIGFAIPIAAVKGMLKGVLAGDGVEHPYLGVRYMSITPAVAKKFDLPVEQGSFIKSGNKNPAIVSGSPADKAGLQAHDIITKVGGVKVGDNGSVASLVAEYRAGETVKLTVLRDGETIEIDVKLGVYQP